MLLTKSTVNRAGSNITFKVTYTDGNNYPPIQATLSALPQQMTYVSGSYNTGALYQLTTTLSPGAHTRYYVFSDGQTSWGLPLSPGSIGFTVSAATSLAHSISLRIPALDLSNILSNPADPGDID
jgi:hypothetical protein